VRRVIGLLCACLAGMMQPVNATGQPAPTSPVKPANARAVQREVQPAGHGWIWLRDDAKSTGGEGDSASFGVGTGTVIMHLPPRGGSAGEEARAGTVVARGKDLAGSTRLAAGFGEVPERLAWWNNRVYIALRPERMLASESGDWQRRVLGLTAARVADGLGGGGATGWEYPPGRPELVATLPGKADLLAFGASKLGPVAIIRGQRRATGMGSSAGRLEMLVHHAAMWYPVRLASLEEVDPLDPSGSFWLPSARDGLMVAALNTDERGLSLWEGELPWPMPPAHAKKGRADAELAVDWTERPLSLKLGAQTGRKDEFFPVPDHLAIVDGHIVAAAWERDGEGRGRLRMATLKSDRADEFEPLEGVPRQYSFAPMDGGGRVAVIWRGEVANGEGDGVERPALTGVEAREVREISVTSGRVLYAGVLKSQAWLTMSEYRTMAIVIVVVMASVVLFVLRRGPRIMARAKPGSEDKDGKGPSQG